MRGPGTRKLAQRAGCEGSGVEERRRSAGLETRRTTLDRQARRARVGREDHERDAAVDRFLAYCLRAAAANGSENSRQPSGTCRLGLDVSVGDRARVRRGVEDDPIDGVGVGGERDEHVGLGRALCLAPVVVRELGFSFASRAARRRRGSLRAFVGSTKRRTRRPEICRTAFATRSLTPGRVKAEPVVTSATGAAGGPVLPLPDRRKVHPTPGTRPSAATSKNGDGRTLLGGYGKNYAVGCGVSGGRFA